MNDYYINKLLLPYLISVYKSLVARLGKSYLTTDATKLYMGLNTLLSDRIVEQINDNGDERIDQDEFVKFMIQLCMGSRLQKLMIAFKVYDLDSDEQIDKYEAKFISYHIYLTHGHRFGISHPPVEQEANQPKHKMMHLRDKDLN